MKQTVTINIKELQSFLTYWLDKVEECYRAEVRQSMKEFKRKHGIK